jgi:hypothetical protein
MALALIALRVQNIYELGAFAYSVYGEEKKDKGVWLGDVKYIDQSSTATCYIRTNTLAPDGIPCPLLLYRYHGRGILLTIDWKVDTIQKEYCTVGK